MAQALPVSRIRSEGIKTSSFKKLRFKFFKFQEIKRLLKVVFRKFYFLIPQNELKIKMQETCLPYDLLKKKRTKATDDLIVKIKPF